MCSVSERFADGCSALCWGGTNTVKSISPLPCSAALNEVAMSSSLTRTVPRLSSPKRSFLCQRLAAASLPYKHAFSKFILLFVWRNKCDSETAVVLRPCCMILSWPQLSISALMRFLQIYVTSVTGREPLCVWKCVCTCVCVGACPHMPMNINDGSCEIKWTLGNPNYLTFIFSTSFPLKCL